MQRVTTAAVPMETPRWTVFRRPLIDTKAPTAWERV